MPKPKYHVFICTGNKIGNENKGYCFSKGGEDIFKKFNEVVTEQKLEKDVLVTSCGCFRCRISKKGPNMVIYPQGIWYSGVKVDDVVDIIEMHIKGGKIVDRLLLE